MTKVIFRLFETCCRTGFYEIWCGPDQAPKLQQAGLLMDIQVVPPADVEIPALFKDIAPEAAWRTLEETGHTQFKYRYFNSVFRISVWKIRDAHIAHCLRLE